MPASSFRGNSLLKTGLYAIDDIDLVNIIAMPDVPRIQGAGPRGVCGGDNLCRRPPRDADRRYPDRCVTIDQMQTWIDDNDSLRHPNAAVYFPRTLIPDPLNQNRPRSLASSGTIGGFGRAPISRAASGRRRPAPTRALRNVDRPRRTC